MTDCLEKVIIASSMIFGGLTFLLPSALTIYMYATKWIPEETDPARQGEMVAVLVGSAIAGLVVVGSGLYYLASEKCI